MKTSSTKTGIFTLGHPRRLLRHSLQSDFLQYTCKRSQVAPITGS